MTILLEILLLLAGVFLLGLTYKMYRKEWQHPTWICALLGIVCLLSTQGWVRGFFQTGILTLGYEYGDRLNSFQETVSAIEGTLRRHQSSIDNHQVELGTQQNELLNNQSTMNELISSVQKQQEYITSQQADLDDQGIILAKTALDLDENQKRLGDIEALVENIYNRTRSEKISSGTIDKMLYAYRSTNAIYALFLLSEVPVKGSVQAYFNNNPVKPGFPVNKNLVSFVLSGTSNQWTSTDFFFTYVVDPRQTTPFMKLDNIIGDVYVDGQLYDLPKE